MRSLFPKIQNFKNDFLERGVDRAPVSEIWAPNVTESYQHSENNDPETPTEAICGTCGNTFLTAQECIEHMKSCTTSSCQHCGYKSEAKSDMEAHISAHHFITYAQINTTNEQKEYTDKFQDMLKILQTLVDMIEETRNEEKENFKRLDQKIELICREVTKLKEKKNTNNDRELPIKSQKGKELDIPQQTNVPTKPIVKQPSRVSVIKTVTEPVVPESYRENFEFICNN